MSTRNKLLFLLFSSIFSAILLNSCGGGSSGTGADPDITGLSEKRLMSSITEEEHGSMCNRIAENRDQVLGADRVCMLGAVFFTELLPSGAPALTQCMNFHNQCLMGQADTLLDLVQSECVVAVPADLQSCNATVEELNSCLDDFIQITRMAAQNLACVILSEPVSMQLLLNTADKIPETPACNSLRGKCPQALLE